MSSAYGVADIGEAINDAVQALAGMSGWECLRKVVRIVSARPAFALPQGCAGLVRACVAGRPASVRGQDFEFLHSGPGDLRRPPPGFCPVPASGLVDRGYSPLTFDPLSPYRLLAVSSGTEPAPELSVNAVLASGEICRFDVPVLVSGDDVESATPDGHAVVETLGVTVDVDCTSAYTNLFAVLGDGSRVRVAQYHPQVSAPRFRRYEIQGMPPGLPVDVLAEVRLDPLPLVESGDILPFDSLEPVEWMIQSAWYTKSGEIDAAQKMHALAAGWLKAREITNDTVQTPVVVNSLFSGSPGEVSMEAVNI